MARIITKELPLAIVKKLGAVKLATRSKKHDLYAVVHARRIILYLSIRRGSEKDLGHDHFPRDLHVSPRLAKLLAQCPLSREEYLQLLRDQSLL